MVPSDPETERQEIVLLEREAAHAIQLSDGTFFRRVYSDDFAGTLSRGESVNKAGFINAVQSTAVRYEAFNATDIQIHIFRDTAVATCLWSARGVVKGETVNSQMRVMHVYVNGGDGWKVVAGQTSPLPPYTQQAL
jgi:ketosteroid isomerase-like protein